MQKIYFSYDFTDLNSYIKAERTNKYIASNLKKMNTNIAEMLTRSALNTKEIEKYNDDAQLKFIFTWYRKDKKKDPDNIAFGKKFILDGMQKAGLFKNDGANTIINLEDRFKYEDKTGVLVVIHE